MTVHDRVFNASVLALLTLLLAACGEDGVTPTTGEDIGDLPADNIGYDVRHLVTEDGIRRALLLSDTAYIYEDAGHTELRGLNVTFHDERGAESGTLTARSGQLDSRTNALVARGDAVLVTRAEDGETRIASEELHFEDDRIWSDVATTSTEPGGRTVRGSSFESDLEFQNIRIRDARTVADDEAIPEILEPDAPGADLPESPDVEPGAPERRPS